jgi:hypothetical protein
VLRRKCAFAAKNTVRFSLGFQCSDFTAAGGVLVPKKWLFCHPDIFKIRNFFLDVFSAAGFLMLSLGRFHRVKQH